MVHNQCQSLLDMIKCNPFYTEDDIFISVIDLKKYNWHSLISLYDNNLKIIYIDVLWYNHQMIIFVYPFSSTKCICWNSNGDESDDSQMSSAVNVYSTKENVLYED